MRRVVIMIFFFSNSIVLFSQPGQKTNNADLVPIANDFCNCAGPSFDTLHPRVKEFIKDILLYGLNSASAGFNKSVESLSDSEKSNISESLAFIQDKANLENLFSDCFSRLESKYPSAHKLINESDSKHSEKFIELLLEQKKCELLGILIRIGESDVATARPGDPLNSIKLEKRNFQFVKSLKVNQDSVHIKIYRNAAIDQGVVSVYLNYNTVVENFKLTAKPFEATICISDQEINSLVFYAEKGGPYKTILEIKHDGKAEKIPVSPDLKKNVSILIEHMKD